MFMISGALQARASGAPVLAWSLSKRHALDDLDDDQPVRRDVDHREVGVDAGRRSRCR